MMTTFEALADPMRRRILDLLHERPHLVGELAELLSISQPGISKHLRVLREVRLVRVRQDAQRHWYELRPEPLAEVHAWLESYRHLWDERFHRLDNYLQTLQEEEHEGNPLSTRRAPANNGMTHAQLGEKRHGHRKKP